MVDRLAEFERAKSLLGSKNLACAALGCSKSTVNRYINPLRNAEYLTYNIESIRTTKYKELKQMLVQLTTTISTYWEKKSKSINT